MAARKRKAAPKKKRTATSKKRAPKQASVRSQPLIAVRDVCASARFYARLLGLEALGDRHPDHRELYDRIIDPRAGDLLVLQLHAWEKEDHPNLVGRDQAKVGHGVLLWFELDDFDAAVERARELRAEVVEEPHVNPAPNHREMWLRDPDGYLVVICSVDDEAD